MVKSAAIQAVVAVGAVAVATVGVFGGARLGAVIAPSTTRVSRVATSERSRPERLVRANASVLVLHLHELPHGFAPVPAHTGPVTRAWLAANATSRWYRTIVGAHLGTEWQVAFRVPQLFDLRDPTPDVDGSLLGIGEVVSSGGRRERAADLPRSGEPDPPHLRLDEAPAAAEDRRRDRGRHGGHERHRDVDVHLRIANVTESITVGGLAGALTAARAFEVARLAASAALAAARGGTSMPIAAETIVLPRPVSPLDLYS